jgi:hypothetical protein
LLASFPLLRLRRPPDEPHPAVTRDHDADAQDRAEMGFSRDVLWLTPAIARQWRSVVYPIDLTPAAVQQWREYLEQQAAYLAAGCRTRPGAKPDAIVRSDRPGHVVRAERLAVLEHDLSLLGPAALPSPPAPEKKRPALYCNLPPGETVEISQGMPARFWASVFGVHRNHIKGLLTGGGVRAKQITSRQWVVALSDVPQAWRGKCRGR